MELITTYPAAVNSKATVTMGVLDQATTIVEVLDATVLPEAPNLLVLGTDQTAETVLMTARENNTLTIQRAVQGIAKSWPAGTQIARNFTGKDWDDMRSNVEAIVTKILGLTASDVGARPDTWMPTASDVGALPIINAQGPSWDMNTVLKSGPHFAFYETNLNTLNTPYNLGKTPSAAASILSYSNAANYGTQIAFLSASLFMIRTLANGNITEWSYGFLPLDGSVPMSGALKMEGSSLNLGKESEWGSGHYSSINQDSQNVRIITRYNGIAREYFFGDASKNLAETIGLYDVSSGVGKYYNIFGEHNKPSGSYTGNGSATSRTIEIGGIGNAVIVICTANSTALIITASGAFGKTGGSTGYFSYDTVHFTNGIITIASTDGSLNASGKNYTYQVL